MLPCRGPSPLGRDATARLQHVAVGSALWFRKRAPKTLADAEALVAARLAELLR
jgi:hypothetical protein